MQLREGMAYATGLSICLALFAAAELSNQKGSHRSCQKLQHPLYYRKHRKQELHSNMSWSHHCNTHTGQAFMRVLGTNEHTVLEKKRQTQC